MPSTITKQDDDLVYTEAFVTQLRSALSAVLHPSGGFEAQHQATIALHDAGDFCLPSCGFLEDGECGAGDGCPCLCAHDDTAAV